MRHDMSRTRQTADAQFYNQRYGNEWLTVRYDMATDRREVIDRVAFEGPVGGPDERAARAMARGHRDTAV